jgi:hypothetical protein
MLTIVLAVLWWTGMGWMDLTMGPYNLERKKKEKKGILTD